MNITPPTRPAFSSWWYELFFTVQMFRRFHPWYLSVASWTCQNDFKKKKSTTRVVKEVGVGMEVCTCSRVWVISTSIYMYTIIPYTDWMHGYYWATLGWEGQTHLQPGGSTNLTWRWGKVGHFERIKRGGKASVRPPIRTHASERFLDM